MSLSVELLNNVEEFRDLESDWDQLAGVYPFRQFAWAWNWWHAYQHSHRELFLLVCRDTEQGVVGIAPLTLDRSMASGRRLMLLGGGEACGDGMSFLSSQEHIPIVASSIGNWLAEGPGLGKWDLLYLDGIEAHDPMTALLSKSLRAQGISQTSRDDVARWVVSLPDSWEAYVAGLGKRTRRFMRQLQSRRTEAGPLFHFSVPSNATEFETAFEQLVGLHKMRWKETDGDGAFSSARFENFLRAAARTWFAQGKLVLQTLSIHGEAAAAAIGILHGNAIHLFLLGRNPKFDRQQAGWQLNIELIQNAIAQGVTTFDFLRGNEPYKLQLGGKPIPQTRLSFFAPGAINQLRSRLTNWAWSAHRIRRYAEDHLGNGHLSFFQGLLSPRTSSPAKPH